MLCVKSVLVDAIRMYEICEWSLWFSVSDFKTKVIGLFPGRNVALFSAISNWILNSRLNVNLNAYLLLFGNTPCVGEY